MKKRIVSALLLCTITASLLAGCGSKTASETAKTEDGKVKIDLWYSGGKTAVNVFQEIVDEFNESQDGYEVSTTTQADLYRNIRETSGWYCRQKCAGYGSSWYG